MYIDTEGSFVAGRFREIASAAVSHIQQIANLQQLSSFVSCRKEEGVVGINKNLLQEGDDDDEDHGQDRPCNDAQLKSLRSSVEASFSLSNILDNCHYVRVVRLVDLVAIILTLDEILEKHRHNIRLVVIDSLAFHLRYGTNQAGPDYGARSRMLFSLGQRLQFIASTYHVAVVVTNHLTSTKVMTHSSSAEGSREQRESIRKFSNKTDEEGKEDTPNSIVDNDCYSTALIPALGESWAHVVSTRVLLNMPAEGHVVRQDGTQVRVAALIKSPSYPRAECKFCIGPLGVRSFV